MVLDFRSPKGQTVVAIVAIIIFCFGLLVGHLITPSGGDSGNQLDFGGVGDVVSIVGDQEYVVMQNDKWKSEQHLIPKILESVIPENIKNNLKYLSEKPHLATTPRDEELARYLQTKFKEAGFDSSELVPYNLYLTQPDPKNPNKITLHRNGAQIFESNHKEKPIHEDDADPNFVDAFNAFTPAGTVSTEPGVGVVYVNYGRIEDFKKLKKLAVNITGHIALVRYGKIYRGNKIAHAEQFGAKGIIIFSDPQDVAPDGVGPEDVYDKTWWLPGTGIQRGSTYLGDGDPLTPGWPSTEHAYRIKESEADLHKIVAQPIGYDDAREILSRLGGDAAPDDWQGGLPGLTYNLGPLFNALNSDVELTLTSNNVGKIRKSYNVISVIKGAYEPDRYVMIGNHRDAWGYGAADPSSGTAQLLETARVFGTLLKEGWRPRRTLVFCSWGAEEYGMIGSTEWVEEHINKLQDRTVAYINTDTCVSGSALGVAASPLLQGVFFEMTKLVPGVHDSSKTLFDEWKSYYQKLEPESEEHPTMKTLGSGSDYAPFTVYGGIPAADIWFKHDKTKYNISAYPFYHTGYETFYMVSQFVDPSFKIHQGCSRLALLTLKFLADSAVIPYSIEKLPKIMLDNLKRSKNRDRWIEIYDKYYELENAISRFDAAVIEFQNKIKSHTLSAMKLRSLNDQMMKLEQIFILPEGLPGRPTVRNALFAPSQFNSYASDGFPALGDLLYELDALNATEKIRREKQIRRHISDLTIMTDRAASHLQDVDLI